MDFYLIQEYFLSAVIIGLAVFTAQSILERRTKRRRLLRFLSALACLFYLLALYEATIGGRIPYEGKHLQTTLFWSYREIWENGNRFLMRQNLENIFAFLPLGVFFEDFFGEKMRWYFVFAAGALLSASIELAQYLFKLGLFEFDDIFHNTLGAMIGYAIAKIIKNLVNLVIKKRNYI